MLTYLRNVAQRFADDPGYMTRWGCKQVLGKVGIKVSCEAAEHVMPTALTALVGIGRDQLGHQLGLFLGAPLSIGFSVMMVQGDYAQRRKQICDQFRQEIASVTHTAPGKVTLAELDKAGKLNPAIGQVLEVAKEERDWSFGISAVATTIATVAAFAIKAMPAVAGLSGALPFGLAPMLIAGVAAGGIYLGSRLALHYAAEQAFGLEKTTVHDRIHEIRREQGKGRAVSQEKVFAAYLEAHPETNREIKANFGHRFTRLSDDGKRAALSAIGPQIGLEQLTEDINTKRVRVTEVAFWVHGQKSGVVAQEEPMAAAVFDSPADEAPQRLFAERVGRRMVAMMPAPLAASFTERYDAQGSEVAGVNFR